MNENDLLIAGIPLLIAAYCAYKWKRAITDCQWTRSRYALLLTTSKEYQKTSLSRFLECDRSRRALVATVERINARLAQYERENQRRIDAERLVLEERKLHLQRGMT